MADHNVLGVYVEEYKNELKKIAGISTSTAGFLGVAERGDLVGTPVLVTSFAEYQQYFGGYLSEKEYGRFRFLPYAVEQFFANGGLRCYVMRAETPAEPMELWSEQTAGSIGFIGVDNGKGKRTGLQAFLDIEDIGIMAAPGIADFAVQEALIRHCEQMGNRFAVLDFDESIQETGRLIENIEKFDSSYAAMYHPWIKVMSPEGAEEIALPPSGSVAGIYVRCETTRGLHKPPANELVTNCTGLLASYGSDEQAKLNQKGVNLIRSIPGQGIRVWGARTCSTDSAMKYVNVSRLFLYIRQMVKALTDWVVDEPNNQHTWFVAQQGIQSFLMELWKKGALNGSSTEQAFYVEAGPKTMTQDDILNGRFSCEVGVALSRPGEFTKIIVTHQMKLE